MIVWELLILFHLRGILYKPSIKNKSYPNLRRLQLIRKYICICHNFTVMISIATIFLDTWVDDTNACYTVLMEQTILFSWRLFPETHATPSLWVAVDRNGICVFLLCVAFPKCELHQVYELLLIEIELIHRNLNIAITRFSFENHGISPGYY